VAAALTPLFLFRGKFSPGACQGLSGVRVRYRALAPPPLQTCNMALNLMPRFPDVRLLPHPSATSSCHILFPPCDGVTKLSRDPRVSYLAILTVSSKLSIIMYHHHCAILSWWGSLSKLPVDVHDCEQGQMSRSGSCGGLSMYQPEVSNKTLN
jgi:hypothetical protein